MTTPITLPLRDPRATLETAGGKGASLARLLQAGFPVPDGFHITTAAYQQFVAENALQPRILGALSSVDPASTETLDTTASIIHDLFMQSPIPAAIAAEISRAYTELSTGEEIAVTGGQPVAVRSSATAEDLPGASFAGQQETYLNIRGIDNVLEAVKACWASLWTARAIAYRARQGIDPDSVALAVVVQVLIPADSAGVLFTANPLNGSRAEMVINAAWGLGEAIVSGQVSPDTLIVDTASGKIKEMQIGDKTMMTVPNAGGVASQPVSGEHKNARVLDEAAVGELVELGRRIEAHFGAPQDIEWCRNAGRTSIVQSRPITALPDAPVPVEWKLPNPKDKVMRGSSVDLMPDPLTPLFATWGIPTLNQWLKQIFHLGTPQAVYPDFSNYKIITVNDFAYLSINLTLREWLWIGVHMLPALPGMLRNVIPRWRDEELPRYTATVQHWSTTPPANLSNAEILNGVDELLQASSRHLVSLLTGSMGTSAGSEGLFTILYDKLVRQGDDPPATTYLMGYNSIPIQAEKSIYDLAEWAHPHPELAAYLVQTPSASLVGQLSRDEPPPSIPAADWQDFRARLDQHLQRFGYLIYDLDFAKPVPQDDPTPILEACKMTLRGLGSNPHQRQQKLENLRIRSSAALLGRLRGLRRWAVAKSLKWAQSLAEIREDAIAAVGLGYPLLRRLLGELGGRLVAAGRIEDCADIYWLTRAELDAVVVEAAGAEAAVEIETGSPQSSLADSVKQRKATWKARKQLIPPPMLPPSKKYMGINMDAFLPATAADQVGSVLKGIGASAGVVTAPACVLHGPGDFAQMQPGCVLVAAITTPAWTPLFAMAAAVVTDVGGPLSHGSIVAREYGIPAVLNTGVATQRIRNGDTLTVDGNKGIVTISQT